MRVLDDIVSAWTKKRSVDEVDAIMQEAGVPAGRIYRVPDMLEDEHFRAREAIVSTPTEEYPELRMHNVFPKMSRTQGEIRWTGQWQLGAHNAEVYGELLGLDATALEQHRRDGTI